MRTMWTLAFVLSIVVCARVDNQADDSGLDIFPAFKALQADVTHLKTEFQKQKQTSAQLLTEITKLKTSVGLTAFGTGEGKKPYRTILKFPIIKSSYGLTLLSAFKRSGKFTCEKSGLYLISITVMSCSTGESKYSINKNNNEIGQYYIGQSQTSSTDCNSATGTIVQQLDKNDTIYVKTGNFNMYVLDKWSSFSVVKLK